MLYFECRKVEKGKSEMTVAGTLKVDSDTHSKFKAACALRGVKMQDATAQALKSLMRQWDRQDSDAVCDGCGQHWCICSPKEREL